MLSNGSTPLSCAISSSKRRRSAGLPRAWHRFRPSRRWLWLLLTGAGLAQALPEDADLPINIQADTGQIDQSREIATYTGNVQVDQGTLRVRADHMVVEYRNQKVVRIIFSGAPASYQQQLSDGAGPVLANADEITYYTRNERLLLNGNALLLQEGNEIRGNEIRYDIVAGRIDAESRADQPVRMTLQPDRGPADDDDAETGQENRSP